jgi:hypothetical protein
MRCDTTLNEEPTLTADMIGFTESVVSGLAYNSR